LSLGAAGAAITGGATKGAAVESSLRARRDAGHKLLITYVTGGLCHGWRRLVEAMVAAGADAVEVGIPFSDPVMDGPTIQQASLEALQSGATPFGIVGELTDTEVSAPLVAMTYYNIAFRAGNERFARSLVEAGVRGAIIPDVPLEELDPWSDAAGEAGVETILLAAPVTPDDRLARICERSRGFVYGVNLMGVTGERSTLADSAAVLARRLKELTDKPVVMGFGVSSPEHAVEACREADGVVVASALMRAVLEGAGPEEVGEMVGLLRSALDRG
jgi:tryptophan synthase alpha chain